MTDKMKEMYDELCNEEGFLSRLEEGIRDGFKDADVEIKRFYIYHNRYDVDYLCVDLEVTCDITYVTDYKAHDDYDTNEERCTIYPEVVIIREDVERRTLDDLKDLLLGVCISTIEDEIDHYSDYLTDYYEERRNDIND